MNRKQLDIFKILILLFGLAVIALAYNFLVEAPADGSPLPAKTRFMWVNIFACYVVFFVPLFFSSLTLSTIDTKITSAVHIWIASSLFIFAVVVLIALAQYEKIQVKHAVIIEMIVLFLCAIFTYFGYFAGNHIAEVQANEKRILFGVTELKNAYEMLKISADTFGEELHEQKTKILSLCDNIRYLSPVGSSAATSLETKLIALAGEISALAANPSELNAKIAEADLLFKQRKSLRA